MARQVLPTNYKDDVLAAAMNGKRRYLLTDNGDGSYTLDDVSTYTQVGSVLGQAAINAICAAVNASVDQARIIETEEDLQAVTEAGYVAGAQAVGQLIKNIGFALLYDGPSTNTATCLDDLSKYAVLLVDGKLFSRSDPASESFVNYHPSGWNEGGTQQLINSVYTLTFNAEKVLSYTRVQRTFSVVNGSFYGATVSTPAATFSKIYGLKFV